MKEFDLAIIGGGAAGFFSAINYSEFFYGKDAPPKNSGVIILEKSRHVLSKVKVSGGGRCNVTNRISDPLELAGYYPRGGKALIGPFNIFSSTDTVKWFNARGVNLKTEEDGRIFPVTNDSQTIINCLLKETEKNNIRVQTGFIVNSVIKAGDKWEITSTEDEKIISNNLLVASGSNERIWNIIKNLKHTIIPPIPSLFTFNCSDKKISGLAGVSVNSVQIKVEGAKLKESGPLLITHSGFSGPAVLKLSAWGAIELHKLKYHFNIIVNWLPGFNPESIKDELLHFKLTSPKKKIHSNPQFNIPIRLWEKLAVSAEINEEMIWNDISAKQLHLFSEALTNCRFNISGKSTFKEEFVTCGGADLKEVNFKTMESKIIPGLFFAGEVLDIDAVTGGFNFQSAWTTAYIAAKGIAGNLSFIKN